MTSKGWRAMWTTVSASRRTTWGAHYGNNYVDSTDGEGDDSSEGAHGAPVAAPRVWSLLDVIRFLAPEFASAIATLSYTATYMEHSPKASEEVDWQEHRSAVTQSLIILSRLSLSAAMEEMAKNLQDSVRADTNREVIAALTVTFYKSLIAELKTRVFLQLTAQEGMFYREAPTQHEEAIAQAFGDWGIADDFAAAARCYALGEGTASVFHSMRALERGLRWMASSLDAMPAEDIESAQWGKLLDKIHARLRAMEKGQVPRARHFDRFNGAAMQMSEANVAWRRDVSHAKGRYEPDEALRVLGVVIPAMERLATLKAVEEGAAE